MVKVVKSKPLDTVESAIQLESVKKEMVRQINKSARMIKQFTDKLTSSDVQKVVKNDKYYNDALENLKDAMYNLNQIQFKM